VGLAWAFRLWLGFYYIWIVLQTFSIETIILWNIFSIIINRRTFGVKTAIKLCMFSARVTQIKSYIFVYCGAEVSLSNYNKCLCESARPYSFTIETFCYVKSLLVLLKVFCLSVCTHAGMSVEGIYRRTGQNVAITQLLNLFNNGQLVDFFLFQGLFLVLNQWVNLAH